MNCQYQWKWLFDFANGLDGPERGDTGNIQAMKFIWIPSEQQSLNNLM